MLRRLRVIVGISGASGAIYGMRLLMSLRKYNIESHLIISRTASVTIKQELGMNKSLLYEQADVIYATQDIGAAIASGSYSNMGMLIAPCSIRTMSEINTGVTSSLMSRVADVTLKERRKLVLMIRETPLHLGHLRTMVKLAEIGAIIMPPVPAFYIHPRSIDDIVNYTVDRALNIFGIATEKPFTWSGVTQNYSAHIKK
ncbi:UbiX family flavin prenyltransferase [Blochmannia endosymbiont of Camponotus (Colobopsis) obliquus]|uniref:UbiX family flavin prenyltransferase n=1 Tax=Blochmannia endosymbiont of Camponotus (Colobopsis) obliquus TaxID=1505597 RepID=UPI00061A82E4|nr:UbiX family flavin prenyltransferase [Blochmannia endosymbiont of Camponotus (Colobopsis) obliquus]AKC60534.1 3-octaprenyl-4-hydroxybenzoate carboxy-lyase [Blochmannia endosymbiont of Camponotus (Colobopsis) obliquus]